MTRRLFVNLTLMLGAITALPSALMAKRNDGAFNESGKEGVDSAIKALYGSSKTMNGKLKIKAPAIAENGAAVPITVSSDAENVESLSIFVEGNPKALVAVVEVGKNTVPKIATRIKLGKTSNVIAVAKIGGKLYSSKKNVKVTIGGCGG